MQIECRVNRQTKISYHIQETGPCGRPVQIQRPGLVDVGVPAALAVRQRPRCRLQPRTARAYIAIAIQRQGACRDQPSARRRATVVQDHRASSSVDRRRQSQGRCVQRHIPATHGQRRVNRRRSGRQLHIPTTGVAIQVHRRRRVLRQIDIPCCRSQCNRPHLRANRTRMRAHVGTPIQVQRRRRNLPNPTHRATIIQGHRLRRHCIVDRQGRSLQC